jgi:hypothetical protein
VAISKRLRYEVLRRDGHACRYCGARAPQVPLTIDHITPKTLGGSDSPDNLAAACFDCNAGKSSTPPDDALVKDVNDAERDWQSSSRPYREAVYLLCGAVPGLESEGARAVLAAAFDENHADDEESDGTPTTYSWPDDLKAFATAVEKAAEIAWMTSNAVHRALGTLVPGRVPDLIKQARDEYVTNGLDFTDAELECHALGLAVDATRERAPS